MSRVRIRVSIEAWGSRRATSNAARLGTAPMLAGGTI